MENEVRDYGKTVPYVWLGFVISILFIIFGINNVAIFLNDSNGSELVVSILILLFALISFFILIGFYRSHLTLENRKYYEVQYTRLAVISLVLCMLWIIPGILMSIDMLIKNYSRWQVGWSVNIFAMLFVVVLTLGLIPMFVFIKKSFKKILESEKEKTINSLRNGLSLATLWSIVFLALELFLAIKLNRTEYWVIFSYLLITLLFCELTMRERHRYLLNELSID